MLLLLGVGVVAALFRWWQSGRRPTITLVFLTVMIVVLGWFEWRWQQVEAAAEAGVAVVAGEESAGVRCQRLSEAWFYARNAIGYVGADVDGNPEEAVLTYEVCTALRAWLESDKSAPTEDEVLAVHVTSHEAAHLTGVFDESVAECIAMKNDVAVAMAMGATREQAEALAAYYVANLHSTLPDDYLRSVEC